MPLPPLHIKMKLRPGTRYKGLRAVAQGETSGKQNMSESWGRTGNRTSQTGFPFPPQQSERNKDSSKVSKRKRVSEHSRWGFSFGGFGKTSSGRSGCIRFLSV